MKKMGKVFVAGLMVAFLVALFGGTAVSSDNVTIEGVVSDVYQLITDQDEVYDIADTEKGQELMEMVGKKVKVIGAVEEEDGVKTIKVANFEVMED
jgi:hypothetical protein